MVNRLNRTNWWIRTTEWSWYALKLGAEGVDGMEGLWKGIGDRVYPAWNFLFRIKLQHAIVNPFHSLPPPSASSLSPPPPPTPSHPAPLPSPLSLSAHLFCSFSPCSLVIHVQEPPHECYKRDIFLWYPIQRFGLKVLMLPFKLEFVGRDCLI
jgi:hypothetical protein